MRVCVFQDEDNWALKFANELRASYHGTDQLLFEPPKLQHQLNLADAAKLLDHLLEFAEFRDMYDVTDMLKEAKEQMAEQIAVSRILTVTDDTF